MGFLGRINDCRRALFFIDPKMHQLFFCPDRLYPSPSSLDHATLLAIRSIGPGVADTSGPLGKATYVLHNTIRVYHFRGNKIGVEKR
jgi:hypothetical protein